MGGIDNSDWAKMIYEFVNAKHVQMFVRPHAETVFVLKCYTAQITKFRIILRKIVNGLHAYGTRTIECIRNLFFVAVRLLLTYFRKSLISEKLMSNFIHICVPFIYIFIAKWNIYISIKIVDSWTNWTSSKFFIYSHSRIRYLMNDL